MRWDPIDHDSNWSVVKLSNQTGLGEFRIDSADVGSLVDEQTFYDRTWVWHTHPAGKVGPSEGDLRAAAPAVKNLVMTIPTKETVLYERIWWPGRPPWHRPASG